MKRRAVAGIAIVSAWGGGMGVLVQHEYFRPRLERLAEAATRVAPATMYYAAMQGDRQVGFASSTIDTANTTVTENDYFVVEVPSGTSMRRATARTGVTLSRALHLSQFNLSLDADSARTEMTGRVVGDSVLLVHSSASPKSDTTRVSLAGPLLLPTLVPLVVGLSEKPTVGKRYVLPVFNPTTKSSTNVGYTIRAESLFVLSDSAVLDTAVAPPVWRATRPDTVRAWEVAPDSGVAIGFSGWVDEQGRIVATSQLGFTLRRQPYELAFRNWQNDPSAHASGRDPRRGLDGTGRRQDAQGPSRFVDRSRRQRRPQAQAAARRNGAAFVARHGRRRHDAGQPARLDDAARSTDEIGDRDPRLDDRGRKSRAAGRRQSA